MSFLKYYQGAKPWEETKNCYPEWGGEKVEQFWTTLKTKNWITLTSIKTRARGEIRCPIANTMVKHSKKAKLNIMHIFWGFFFGPANIFQSDKIFTSVSPNDWQLLSKFREVCFGGSRSKIGELLYP